MGHCPECLLAIKILEYSVISICLQWSKTPLGTFSPNPKKRWGKICAGQRSFGVRLLYTGVKVSHFLLFGRWDLYCIKPHIQYSGNKPILKGAEVFMFPSLGQVTADSNLKMNLRISIFILFLLASPSIVTALSSSDQHYRIYI